MPPAAHGSRSQAIGSRLGLDGAGRKKGAKLHLAVDTLGHLLALHVTPADADDRAELGRLAEAVQAASGENVDLAAACPRAGKPDPWVDQGYTGGKPAAAAQEHGIELEVVRLPEAKRGFVLLPRRLSAALTSLRGIGQSPMGLRGIGRSPMGG